MPLKLVTGPANAEKAGVVLDGVRAAAADGRDPILVVPTAADLEAYRRELAGDGVLLGVSIERFDGLLGLMAGRAGVTTRPLSGLGAERLARVAAAGLVEHDALPALADSARTPGFAAALARFAGELGEAGVTPQRFAAALADWARIEPGRGPFTRDLAALYRAYDAALGRIGRTDAARHARAVSDALRVAPELWGPRPVFLYGFDDLTPAQLDAIETLAAVPDAGVTVSLPYEPGRAAFVGRAGAYQQLSALAGPGGELRLEANPEHYEAASRAALHGVERALLEPGAEHVDPGNAIELLEGGGERAELELVAERIARLRADGVALHEIAVAVRDARDAAPLIEAVFADAAIPIALERRVGVADTGLGRALLALLRCAVLGGGVADLLEWLRSPGIVTAAARLDRLERDLRRGGVTDVDEARAVWLGLGGFPLDAIDELRAAAGAGPARLTAVLATQVRRLLHAPWRSDGRGAAPVLSAAQALEARAAATLLHRLHELSVLARTAPPLAPGVRELHDHLAAAEVRAGLPPRPGAVTIASPLALRARRVHALFLCRLREPLFPQAGRPDPFLADDERVGLALASGLALRGHETTLDEERYLLYSAVSRPTALLVLSWHVSDDDGEAQVRSPFVDDVLDCLSPSPAVTTRRLGDITWGPEAQVSAHQAQLSAAADDGMAATSAPRPAAAGLEHPVVLAELGAREAFSATEIEAYASCPVKWFIERFLRPASLDPDAEPLGRGSVAHAALEHTLRELGEPLTPQSAGRAIALMRRALAEVEAANPLSVNPRRRVAARHRLEADLARYLQGAAASGSSYLPSHFELSFGLPDSDREAVAVADGLSIRGKIDRVDLSPPGDRAIVVDYKGRATQDSWTAWLAKGKLQAGLYALVLEALQPEVEVAGALYQPLGADPSSDAPRGFLRDDADVGRLDVKEGDRVTAAEREELLGDIRRAALRVVDGIRAGQLEPTPESCAWDGSGCAYPGICRCDR